MNTTTNRKAAIPAILVLSALVIVSFIVSPTLIELGKNLVDDLVFAFFIYLGIDGAMRLYARVLAHIASRKPAK